MGASSTGSWNAWSKEKVGGVLLAFVVGGAAMIRAIRAANRINPK